jgi:hypothetical protein
MMQVNIDWLKNNQSDDVTSLQHISRFRGAVIHTLIHSFCG